MWLADENIPKEAIEYLRRCGEDVAAVAEICRGGTDRQVIALAREHGRILLSFDRDHGDLIFNRGVAPPRGVVYLRLYPPDPGALLSALSGLTSLGVTALDGQFTVVSVEGVRQRPLPATS